jgi:hypothetical protein
MAASTSMLRCFRHQRRHSDFDHPDGVCTMHIANLVLPVCAIIRSASARPSRGWSGKSHVWVTLVVEPRRA